MNHTFFALVAVLLLSSCAGSNTAKSPVTSLPTTSGHGEIKLIWNRNVGTYTGFLHPARDGSTICAVNRSGTFFLLREDDGGDALSSFRMETADTITAATSCGDGVVTAATDDGTLLVYDYDGSELWRKELNTRLIASPLVSDGSVFMLGQDGRISAYSARHGDLLWRYVLPLRTLVRTPVDSTPTAANGLIYAGMGNGNIVALQQNNGRVEWQTKLSFARKSGTLSDILDTTTPYCKPLRASTITSSASALPTAASVWRTAAAVQSSSSPCTPPVSIRRT
jgi:outer membrane protein assembly factor BamB